MRLTSDWHLFCEVSEWVHSPLDAGGGKTWGGGGACWVADSRVERRLPPSRSRLTAGEGCPRLGVLWVLPPLSLGDMLHDRTRHLILSYPCLSLGNIFQILQFLTCKKDFIFTAMKPKRDTRLQVFLCSLTGEHFHRDT